MLGTHFSSVEQRHSNDNEFCAHTNLVRLAVRPQVSDVNVHDMGYGHIILKVRALAGANGPCECELIYVKNVV